MTFYRLIRPLLFRMPPERAHALAFRVLEGIQDTPIEAGLAKHYTVDDDRLQVNAFDIDFGNPVGVAAGLDKNARVPNALGALGFGHVEVGGVTARPQPGNPQPRLFRLPEDRALINRMGFNNEGATVVGERLRNQSRRRVPVGINLGKSKAAAQSEAPEDYLQAYEAVADVGDYFVVNVSSPNTPGLRELQARDSLERIIDALRDGGATPLLIKLSPDLATDAVDEVLDVVDTYDLEGIVAVNTTIDRPESLEHRHRTETGGLSGEPLADRAIDIVGYVAERTDKPVIGVGGVDGPEAAYRMIRHGATLVQLYTALIYRGPSLARRINRGLRSRLEEDGFASIEDARGVAID